jgi:extradiol dioxygenase family protein
MFTYDAILLLYALLCSRLAAISVNDSITTQRMYSTRDCCIVLASAAVQLIYKLYGHQQQASTAVLQ